MEKVSLQLDGMGCAGCIKNVHSVLSTLIGVSGKNVAIGSAEVTYDPAQIVPVTITAALAKAGYPARPIGATDNRQPR